jgi:predicted Zn-dependent peptidase
MKAVEATLGQLKFPTSDVKFPRATGFLPPQKHQIFVPKADSTQASVRVGRTLFNRNNPDYLPLRVLNEIFGGYFGSRLMKNIREEKGFTYGISSSLASTYADGYWIIGADVNKDVAQQTIDEIYKEMDILCKEPVPADELETVRNYMLGSFANSINTPFVLAERFKTVHFLGMSYDYYEQFIRTVQTISAEELLHIAQKHYKPELMTEVIVGGENL